MSLLSDTNHTPQRIFSLLCLLDTQGGELEFETIKTWLKPEIRGSGQQRSEDVNIRQLLGATASLGMIEPAGHNRYHLSVHVPESLEAFADLVHDRLVEVSDDHPDSIVLEAFAAMLALTELQQGTAWLDDTAKTRALQIDEAVRRDTSDSEDENSLRFNSTKIAPVEAMDCFSWARSLDAKG